MINALAKSPELQPTVAMASARVLRAQLNLDNGRLEQARNDVQAVVRDHPLHGTAYRILADIEKADGRTDHAIEALSRWGRANPSFRSKVANEIAKLRQSEAHP